MQSVTELPFNQFIGLQTVTEPPHVLRLPAGGHFLNHLGTVHASAQIALAEASGGEFLLRHLGSMNGIVPVVRRLEAKFRKPVTPGDVLELHAEIVRDRGAMLIIRTEAKVNGQIVSEADILAKVSPRQRAEEAQPKG